MAVHVFFETHSISEDNETGAASGWNHSRLSPRGRELAAERRARYADADLAVVLCSDLRRARETAELAFGDGPIPTLLDWRLRECDYGEGNGGPADVHKRTRHEYIDQPYPGGESWRAAVARVRGALDDIRSRWDDQRVLIIGHIATRWALDHHCNGVPLETLATEEFAWQPGWEYSLR